MPGLLDGKGKEQDSGTPRGRPSKIKRKGRGKGERIKKTHVSLADYITAMGRTAASIFGGEKRLAEQKE